MADSTMLTKERIAKATARGTVGSPGTLAKAVDAKEEACSLTEEEMEKIAGGIIPER